MTNDESAIRENSKATTIQSPDKFECLMKYFEITTAPEYSTVRRKLEIAVILLEEAGWDIELAKKGTRDLYTERFKRKAEDTMEPSG